MLKNTKINVFFLFIYDPTFQLSNFYIEKVKINECKTFNNSDIKRIGNKTNLLLIVALLIVATTLKSDSIIVASREQQLNKLVQIHLLVTRRVVKELIDVVFVLVVDVVLVPYLVRVSERVVDVHPHVARVYRVVEVVLALDAQQIARSAPCERVDVCHGAH